MQRRIPLTTPQIFPEDWEQSVKEANHLHKEVELLPHHDDSTLTGINTTALVYAAMHSLSTTIVPTITYERSGAFNRVFRIHFPDGFEIAGRVPKPDAYADGRVESVVAMMSMARFFCGIPVPEVYGWHPDISNPVGAPYILMEWLKGIEPWEKWYDLTGEGRTKMLDELAMYHAQFAKPLPFRGMGSIYFSTTDGAVDDLTSASAYRLGPLSRGPTCTAGRGIHTWPQTTPASHREFWMELWKHEVSSMTKIYGSDRSTVIANEDHPSGYFQEPYTLGQFLDTANDVLVLIQRCKLPLQPELYEPCIVSTDYAFRNIKMDPETLKITSFIDWDDVYAMPFLLASLYPEDICWYDGVGEEWYETGAFVFLPLDEEGDIDESVLRVITDADTETPPPGESPVSDLDTEEEESDNDTPGSSGSASEASKSPESSLPDSNSGAYDRTRRIRDTRLRREYERLLAKYDPRFGIDGFWEVRIEVLKIQHLLTHGWVKWYGKEEWLKARALELNNS